MAKPCGVAVGRKVAVKRGVEVGTGVEVDSGVEVKAGVGVCRKAGFNNDPKLQPRTSIMLMAKITLIFALLRVVINLLCDDK